MLICVDAGPTENAHRVRGIGTVAGALLDAMTPDLADIRYLARRPRANDRLRWQPRSWPAELSGADVRVPLRVSNWWQVLDTRFALPRDVAASGAQVFLATDPHAVALSRRFITVAIVYDVVPLVFPEVYLTNRKAGLPAWLYHRRVARMARADWWIAISEATKRDAVARAGLDASRISVAPLGIDRTVFRPIDPAEARAHVAARFRVDRPYFLFVGARDPRKNLDALIEATEDVDLVVVGQPPRPAPAHVHWLGHVDAADLPMLYAGALAFAFPTLYEGFGLPVLEAMSCGTPVVTSPLSSIPEVAGDAALYADPRDSRALRAALSRISADAGLRADLRQKGLARAAMFSWERTATLVIEALREAARRGRPARDSRSQAR